MATIHTPPFIHELGSRTGTPLVFFHGFPGCHLQSAIFEPWIEKFNLHVLAIDRPGYGHTDAQPNWTLTEFMHAIEATLAEKAINRFYVLGLSGGNPAALSAAHYFGDRVLALGSICGLAPFADSPETYAKNMRNALNVAKRTPGFILKTLVETAIAKFPVETAIENFAHKLGDPDQSLLRDEKIRTAVIASMHMARRQGSAGIIYDLKSYVSKWPVEIEDLKCPYRLWHGEKDKVLPPEMSRYLHKLVPHSKLKLFPDEGHYSLPIRRTDEMLTELFTSAETARP